MKKIPLLFCLVLTCFVAAHAQEPAPTPVCTAGRGGAVYSRGGEVTVEIMAGNPAAIFTSEIRLLSPEPVRTIGSSRAVGTNVNLGVIPEGTELVFGIVVNDSITPGTFTYSTGPASRNPDGVVHADVACDDGGAVVSFEDGHSGGDAGYNDVIFRVRTHPRGQIQSIVFEEVTAPFDRNVETREQARQVNNSQNTQSSPDYWAVYLQGAFQPTTFLRKSQTEETGDADPAGEVTSDRTVRRSAELGFTSAVEQLDGSLTNIGGSTVYVETIRDAAALTGFTRMEIVPIHESGHQWGLTHPNSDPGIMGPCAQNMDRRFNDAHQRAIRQRKQPQGNN